MSIGGSAAIVAEMQATKTKPIATASSQKTHDRKVRFIVESPRALKQRTPRRSPAAMHSRRVASRAEWNVDGKARRG
jgi:hypothetical protein